MRPSPSSLLFSRQLFFLLILGLMLLAASRSWIAPFTWAESPNLLPLSSLISGSHVGKIFGVKSRDCSFAASGCEPEFPIGSVSAPPAHLFSFESDGTNFTDIGAITLGGVPIDVDGLAQSPTYGLLGFRLDHDITGAVSQSTLISIDPTTAEASPVGPALPREIRGASFDAAEQLWVIDAIGAEVLQIDPATGAEVPGTAVSPTFFGTPGIISDAADLAQHPDGTFYIAFASDLYTLDVLTGDLTFVTTQPDQSLAGVTFVPGIEERLFAYDVIAEDDLFRFDFDTGGIPRTTLLADIIPSFSAGRGDLAGPIPSCLPPPSGMIGWFPLDTDGTNILGNTTTVIDLDVIYGPPGKVAGAAQFTGLNSLLVASNAFDSAGLTAFSVDAWIRIQGGDETNRPILSMLDFHNVSFHTSLAIDETNRLRFSIQYGFGTSLVEVQSLSTFSPSDGWIHVAGTWQRNTSDVEDIRLYVNGVDDTDESTYQAVGNNVAQLQIDSLTWNIGSNVLTTVGLHFFDGFIDELELFDRALSQTEIQAIYAAGSAGKCREFTDDLDSDGFSIDDGDCDDTNPAVFPGATEVCDGQDNNCDGGVDGIIIEGNLSLPITQSCYTGPEGTVGVAACQEGSQTCTNGAFGECIGEITPVPEMCDAADNDCDGSVDEDFGLGVTCAVGVGACVNTGVFVCSPDETTSQCNAFPGEPQLEVCNNVDDDCDGQVDISGSSLIQQTCYSGPEGTAGVGECVSGVQTCTAGEFGLCEGEVTPAPELCDGLDNDCDGIIDLPVLSNSELKRIADDADAQDRFGITARRRRELCGRGRTHG